MEYKSTERSRQHCTLAGVTKHIHRRKGKNIKRVQNLGGEKKVLYRSYVLHRIKIP